MKKISKRFLGIFLSVVLVCTLFTAMPVFAAASVDEATGTVTLTAVDATRTEAGNTSFNTYINKNDGRDYAYFIQGYNSTLAWTVNVPAGKAGYYKLTGNASTATRSASTDTWSYVVKVGNTTYLDSTNNTQTTTTGWTNVFNDYTAEYIQLAEGDNTITLGLDYNKTNATGSNIGMLIKYIILTFDADKTAAEAPTYDYTLDSADAKLNWGPYTGLNAHMTDAKKTAGTYGIYFNHNDTASMEWTVNVPTGKAGYYKLAGRAQTAARSASTDKWSYVVKVDGEKYLDSSNNTQNTTTAWAAFSNYEGGYIQLAEGSNTVNLSVSTTMTNASGATPGIIIQYITLEYDEEKTAEEACDYKLLAKDATQEADGDGTFGTYISNGNYDHSAYFKDGYDSKLIWTVNIPEGEGGCYNFVGNLATLIRTNGSDTWSFEVKAENDICTTTISSADNSYATTNATWNNITFKDFAPGYVKLAEGENTITVGIKFTKGDSASATVPAAALSYITLDYDADQTAADPLPETFIKAFSLDKATANAGDTVTATLKVMTSLKPANYGTVYVYVAQYDSQDRLIEVAFDDLTAAQLSVPVTVVSGAKTVKAFAFDSNLIPLVATADLPTATVE